VDRIFRPTNTLTAPHTSDIATTSILRPFRTARIADRPSLLIAEQPRLQNRGSLHEDRRVISCFIDRPGSAGNVRHLRHPRRHILRYVNIHLVSVLHDRIGNIRAERLQEYWDAILSSNLLSEPRLAVEHSALAQSCVLIDLIQGRHFEQSLIQGFLELFWTILRDVSDLSRFGNEALVSRSFNCFKKIIEDIGKALRAKPMDIIEVDADDGAIRRYFVSLLNHRNKVFDHDLSRRRVIEIDHALRIAPSVSSWLGRRKSIAIASGIAISSDMVEDQIDSRYHRRYRILGINVEPSRFAPCDRLIETLQKAVFDSAIPVFIWRMPGQASDRLHRSPREV
jgi:hypothetical protein